MFIATAQHSEEKLSVAGRTGKHRSANPTARRLHRHTQSSATSGVWSPAVAQQATSGVWSPAVVAQQATSGVWSPAVAQQATSGVWSPAVALQLYTTSPYITPKSDTRPKLLPFLSSNRLLTPGEAKCLPISTEASHKCACEAP